MQGVYEHYHWFTTATRIRFSLYSSSVIFPFSPLSKLLLLFLLLPPQQQQHVPVKVDVALCALFPCRIRDGVFDNLKVGLVQVSKTLQSVEDDTLTLQVRRSQLGQERPGSASTPPPRSKSASRSERFTGG